MIENNDYEISQSTMIIRPIHHEVYGAKILDQFGEHYTKARPLHLIKHACFNGGSTYEGRRQAIRKQLGYQQKVPIMIDPYQKIFAFPTTSPEQFDCIWLFPTHIQSTKMTKEGNVLITFHNHQQLSLPLSIHTIQKQINRTSRCMMRFCPQMM